MQHQKMHAGGVLVLRTGNKYIISHGLSNAYLYKNGMLLVGTLLEQKFGCAST